MSKKLKTIFLSAGVFLSLTMLSGCFFHAADTENKNAIDNSDGVQQLHVEGCSLADENGNTVQLTGMSSHGLLWYPEYTNANAMQTLKSYGANVFRLAIYADDAGGGYVQNPEQTMLLTYLAVENAISADIYTIVDWHILQDGNPLTNQDSAVAFFEQISSHYGDCPNILYEICNEPNGITTWDDISAYADRVIPVIRRYAPNAVILVGTPNYSYSVEPVFEQPLDYDNVMYCFHYYAGQFDDHYNELFDRSKKENIPIFVSEWGINYDETGKADISQGETFVKVLNRRGISWVAWSLCNKEEVFSALKPDCEKLSDWTLNDLTDVGKVFFESFQK